MTDPGLGFELTEALNQRCRCIAVDRERLEHSLSALEVQVPPMFASFPVFVPREHIHAMQSVVTALEEVTSLPAYQALVLATRPDIAHIEHGPSGVFFGHDFHLGARGPQLIEINTNAGGALLNVVLARAQKACCSEVDAFLGSSHGVDEMEQTLVEMFRAEHRAQRGDAPLQRIAIVDTRPEQQFLYADFLLVQQMLIRAGIEAVIADPSQLRLQGDRLLHDSGPIDLVYNRLTDFYLKDHQVLHDAYINGAVVMTPHPRCYALHADKRNLAILSDEARLIELGVTPQTAQTLVAGIPRTQVVTAANAQELWAQRKRLFFKPATGFGSKATYRGAKLTRKTWAAILEADYVAQAEVPPSQRTIEVDGDEVPLKLDVRSFVYRGQIQLLAARLYRGQTTNFRTTGGGFAPVYTDRVEPPA